MVIDISNALLSRSQLQHAMDSAALAAASALSNGETADVQKARQLAKDAVLGEMQLYLEGNSAALNQLADTSEVAISPSVASNGAVFYDISVSGQYSQKLTGLTQLFGFKTINIATSSKTIGTLASTAPSALSMYLVLDRSGSMTYVSSSIRSMKKSCQNYVAGTLGVGPLMPLTTPCFYRKIEVVQSAVGQLMKTLKKADPSSSYVRTGAVAYNASQFDAKPLNWGTHDALKYVEDIPNFVTGGTDARDAFQTAADALTITVNGKDETYEQAQKGNNRFSRYIVLLTDGEMTGNGSNWVEHIDTDVRNECADAKSKGIKIFTIAFMAPIRGQELLANCASGLDHYFAADDMDDLNAAFEAIGQSAIEQNVRLTQ